METEKINEKSWREDVLTFNTAGVIEYVFKDTRPNNFIFTTYSNKKPVRVSIDKNPTVSEYDYIFEGKNIFTFSRAFGTSMIRLQCSNANQKIKIISYEGDYTPCFNKNLNEEQIADIANLLIYTTRVSSSTADIRTNTEPIANIYGAMDELRSMIYNCELNLETIKNYPNSQMKTIEHEDPSQVFDTNTWKTQLSLTQNTKTIVTIPAIFISSNAVIEYGDNLTESIILDSTEISCINTSELKSSRFKITGQFKGILRMEWKWK